MKIYTLMVNTLWNAPEKVTSTPKGSSSSTLKKIVAAAIALTLSGEPTEAKAYNKQEFSTEMVANVPWEISPMTENVEQTSVPDYYNKALNWVRKYYPEYEEYFKDIIKQIKWAWRYEEYLLNKEIKSNLWISWSLLKNEKETITTILISLEKAVWKKNLKTKIWITEDSDINEISDDIINWYITKYERIKKNLKNFEQEIDNLIKKGETQWIDIWIEYISISEKYMRILKDLYIEFWFIKNSKSAQDRVKQYIVTLNKTGKKPNQIWQKYIDEYNKIKN